MDGVGMSETLMHYADKRIALHTERRDPKDCWPWSGWKSDKGYPVVWVDRRYMKVSRILLGLTDPKVEARHTCDNPGCVNPAHLISGSHAENMADMKIRRRAARGWRNVNTRLSADDHLAIHEGRAAGEGVRALGRRFGVSHVTILRIERDCASGCIWNLDAIASLTAVTERVSA